MSCEDRPPGDGDLELHRRLLARDPTAPADLAVAFLDRLIAWLRKSNSRQIPEELCTEAAENAIIALSKNPASFDPARKKSLFDYLKMSGQGDLRNRLRQEGRYRQRHSNLESVELSPEAEKYLGQENDPARHMQVQESLQQTEAILRRVRKGLSEAEIKALELVLQGERDTAAYAAVLGLEDLPAAERKREVKRVKERLKLRIRRARPDHDEIP